MADTKHIPDSTVLAVFDKMIAGVPGAVRKGDQNPYCAINGNMYAQMSKLDRIGIRLPKPELEAFREAYDAPLHEGFPGFFQKQYAEIPAALYVEAETLQAWFRKSHGYAKGLPTKPTRKSQK